MPMWWGGLWEKGGFGPPFFLPPGVGPTGRSEKIERLFMVGKERQLPRSPEYTLKSNTNQSQ